MVGGQKNSGICRDGRGNVIHGRSNKQDSMNPLISTPISCKGALSDSQTPTTVMDMAMASKMNPLKTTKQRNTTTRKNQQRSHAGDNNSTDEEDGKRFSNLSGLPVTGSSSLPGGDEEGFHKCDEHEMTNNDEQSGFVDSENELGRPSQFTIPERLCSMSKKLTIRGGNMVDGFGVYSDGAILASPVSKGRIPTTYPTFVESDLSDVRGQTSQTSTTYKESEAYEAMDEAAARRRRRRRRGHKDVNKWMGVDGTDNLEDEATYAIRPADCPGPSRELRKLNELDKMNPPCSIDAFGMKRKRNVPNSSRCDINFKSTGNSSDIIDVANLSLNSPVMHVDDQEMKSDDDDDDISSVGSPFEDDEEGDDDRGREADDEQSDWVSDEWSKKSEESASSRKKRLMKMLRSYNEMITANATGGGPLNQPHVLSSREIRAGKRRVFTSKLGFSTKGVLTANEEVSKFLQDPMQSELRLQPISAEEGVQLSHLASLYSLRMDYCDTVGSEQTIIDDIPKMHVEEMDIPNSKVFPVLTKTSNTTQMNQPNGDPSSPVNAEGSSSSNVSSIYCPTYSDVDSRIGDSKRIRK